MKLGIVLPYSGADNVAYGKPLPRTREYIEIIRKILERNEPLT